MLNDNELFEIIEDQNFWNKELISDTIPRDQYLQNPSIESKSILIVKGPRRAGKTVFLKQIIKKLCKKHVEKKQILFLNLEDYKLINDLNLDLLQRVYDLYREKINLDKPVYFFIDEIQNIPKFESYLRTKYDSNENIKFIVTGSNARLLSKELGTLLTGRISTIEVFPFSFDEFLHYNNLTLKQTSYSYLRGEKIKIKNLFSRYIQYGAIPEFFGQKDIQTRQTEYFENILYRDIIERFNIRNPRLLKDLAVNLFSNASKIISLNKLSNSLNLSANTLQEYISGLEAAYLVFYLKKFSYSFKEVSTSQSKIYCIDTGLANTIGFRLSEDFGRILENLVFLELKRQNKEIYYFGQKQECDFVIKEKTKITGAIQVCAGLINKDTIKRELDGLVEALDYFKLNHGMILTEDKFDDLTYKNKNIKIRPIWFWLLNKRG